MTRDANLTLLTGPDAGELLATALGTVGGELLSWSASQVDHRPGGRTTAAYRTRVRWADKETDETLAASAGPHELRDVPPGVLSLTDGNAQVLVWRFPLDPGLPALVAACDRTAVARLLESFGLPSHGLELRLRSYRPRRRAVVEARAGGNRLFVKVLRPAHAVELHRRHQLLHGAGLPVPRTLGWTDDGLLVLSALSGTPMRNLYRNDIDHAPAAADVTAMLDRLPTTVTEFRHRKSWTDSAQHYAWLIGSALPSEADRARQLAEAVVGAVAELPADAPTHGDFYESQLLMDSGKISGLLDVDTVGPGRRADDIGALLAHLEVLAEMSPEDDSMMRRLGRRWLADFDRTVDPVELRYRVAGVLMSLATGPHRVQQSGWQASTTKRLDLVEQWVDRASAVNPASDLPAMPEQL